MSKKNYTINNATMAIEGNYAKMSEKERREVKGLCDLGYAFQNKNSRNGSKRTKAYFRNSLMACDREIFELLAAEKRKGAYAVASGFASTIIRLGKLADVKPELKGTVERFRELALKDMAEARLYAKSVFEAA